MEGSWWQRRAPRPLTASASPVVLQTLEEAHELATTLAKNNSDWVFISPFDDPLIWYMEPRVASTP